MNISSSWLKSLVALVPTVLLGACKVEPEPEGRFVIVNQSGYDVVLMVFNTKDRQRAPLVVPILNGSSVERTAYGGAGGISYPELFFQGDSVRFKFIDGKQLLHYCPQTQQPNQCSPAHNVLALNQYQIESLSNARDKFTFTLTSADYTTAR